MDGRTLRLHGIASFDAEPEPEKGNSGFYFASAAVISHDYSGNKVYYASKQSRVFDTFEECWAYSNPWVYKLSKKGQGSLYALQKKSGASQKYWTLILGSKRVQVEPCLF